VIVGNRAIVELVYRDETSSQGSVQLNFPISSTYAEVETGANAFISAFAVLTSCVLVEMRIRYRYQQDTRLMAADGSSIKHTGVFLFAVDPPAPNAIISVPGILDSTLLTTGPLAFYQIDRSNVDVAAFIDVIVSNDITNQFGDDITACIVAALQSRV
jgi:hypothetical protein